MTPLDLLIWTAAVCIALLAISIVVGVAIGVVRGADRGSRPRR